MIKVCYFYKSPHSNCDRQVIDTTTDEVVRMMRTWQAPGPGRIDVLREHDLFTVHLHRASEWYVDWRQFDPPHWTSTVVDLGLLEHALVAFVTDDDVADTLRRGRSYSRRPFTPDRDVDYQVTRQLLGSGT